MCGSPGRPTMGPQMVTQGRRCLELAERGQHGLGECGGRRGEEQPRTGGDRWGRGARRGEVPKRGAGVSNGGIGAHPVGWGTDRSELSCWGRGDATWEEGSVTPLPTSSPRREHTRPGVAADKTLMRRFHGALAVHRVTHPHSLAHRILGRAQTLLLCFNGDTSSSPEVTRGVPSIPS